MSHTDTPNSLHVDNIDYIESDGDMVEYIELRDGTYILISNVVMNDDAEVGYVIGVYPRGFMERTDLKGDPCLGMIEVPADPEFHYTDGMTNRQFLRLDESES